MKARASARGRSPGVFDPSAAASCAWTSLAGVGHACVALVVAATFVVSPAGDVRAETPASLTLNRALQRAVASNPRLTAAARDMGIAAGRRTQAGAIPNPELSFELNNALGTGDYRGTRSAETTLQLSQIIELGGKREARVVAGKAEFDGAYWQGAATRLEVLSDTAIAFLNVLSAQRRIKAYDAQIASLNRIVPLLQQRVELGGSSAAEVARAQLAADLARAERERAVIEVSTSRRDLAGLMGSDKVDFRAVAGDMTRVGKPPAFTTLLRALEKHPQLVRWTAVRAQRDAELLSARLKSIPDLRVEAGWRHFRDTNDNAVRLGVSIPIPVWDQNRGGIFEAQENLAKADAERAQNKSTLVLTIGRAHDTLTGSLRELDVLRNSAIPNAKKAVEAMESGYSQGRYSLLELLDVQNAVTQAVLREEEALLRFHTSVAIIEGLTGDPLTLAHERAR